MKSLWMTALALVFAASLNAYAKLPDPTPEEAQKKLADAEKKAKGEEAAKAALAAAQDRVAQRYRATHKHAPPPVPVAGPPPGPVSNGAAAGARATPVGAPASAR